ncbi:hypothetical protein [Sphingopyxis sp. JAI108]|uniref:hypothetical protein n=1 Tax=Sphingopyxis sp. JAI108 TaxID=2723060 RepID=UPI0015CEF409|nr:hypothetical protein [Sphingopyxis sp. JAI108]NYF33648.1 hypothetical protein [Sphingopyxis sp. JAI108]
MSARLPNDTAAIASGAGPAPSQKSTLMLHYEDDDIGLEKRLLFEAATPAAALEIAAGEAAGRHARLFVDGTPLCSLLKADEDNPYWIIATSAGPPNYALDSASPFPEDLT